MASRPQLPELDWESMPAEEILRELLSAFPGRVSLACSFQKEESVLLDMLLSIDPDARVFALDTHVLFPETYAVWREVERRYGTKVEIYEGPTLAAAGRDPRRGALGAEARPVLLDPQGRAAQPCARRARRLDHRACAATSRRRARTRPKVGWDETHELWKANPLADWNDERCWDYIRERGLPYNELHDRGYASIGCTHCTQAGAGREGRWTGTDKVECGLHVPAAGTETVA